MTLVEIRSALAWCSLINIALLILWFLFLRFAHDWTYRVQSKWLNIPVDKFDTMHYAGMALFKFGILLFNLVPYLALRIVG